MKKTHSEILGSPISLWGINPMVAGIRFVDRLEAQAPSGMLKEARSLLSQHDKLTVLMQIYCRFLAEDSIDGTAFDCKVMDAITALNGAIDEAPT